MISQVHLVHSHLKILIDSLLHVNLYAGSCRGQTRTLDLRFLVTCSSPSKMQFQLQPQITCPGTPDIICPFTALTDGEK